MDLIKEDDIYYIDLHKKIKLKKILYTFNDNNIKYDKNNIPIITKPILRRQLTSTKMNFGKYIIDNNYSDYNNKSIMIQLYKDYNNFIIYLIRLNNIYYLGYNNNTDVLSLYIYNFY